MSLTLEEALSAFRAKRSAHYSGAIAELGAREVDSFSPPRERTNMGFQRAWLALVGDPKRRSWCLSTLMNQLPKLHDGRESPFGEKSYALMARLNALSKVAPDPRIAAAALSTLELRAPVCGFVDVERALKKLVAQHADDTTRDAAIAILGQKEAGSLRFPPRVTLTEAELAALPRAKKQTVPVEALWAAVLEAPDDDEALAVLSDALQERGDPRGQLIAMQLREHRGEASDRDIHAAQALVKKHGKDWLGPLRPITYRAELRRGVLSRLELAGRWATSDWGKYFESPLIATLEEIDYGQAKGDIVAGFLRCPAFRKNVRIINVEDDEVLEAIADDVPPKLTGVRTFDWKRKLYETRFLERVLPLVEATPRVSMLGCRDSSIARLSKVVRDRLRVLEVRADLQRAFAILDELPRLERLTTSWPTPIDLVREGGLVARLRPNSWSNESELKKLAGRVERVEVLGNAAFAKRARASLGPKVEVIDRPLPSGLITGVKA